MPELTAEALARSLVSVGYPDAEIRKTLVTRFPDDDVDELVAAAREWEAGIEVGLSEGQQRDERAAHAAEHDLSKSNRPEAP